MFERPEEDDCLHMKGGRIPSPRADYAIRVHTFADGHTNVKCTICGKEWETTHPLAIHMMERTTNHPSSSEVQIETKRTLFARLDHLLTKIIEAEDIMTLLNNGLTFRQLESRIQNYKDNLKKLGEENASNNR